ncbi:MAG: cyd operon YbgE family protein [Gammaproteobacteria bacterium]|nr:cyd operon YbgE family protein [Gammaproteobacteria bacterium]
MSALLDSGWARGISLLAALSLMLLVTLLPRGLTVDDGSPISHGVLTLIMWGLSAGFVHGVGFVPRNRILRMLLGPLVAWTGMALGLFFYVQYFLR